MDMQRTTYAVAAMAANRFGVVDAAIHADEADLATLATAVVSVPWANVAGKPLADTTQNGLLGQLAVPPPGSTQTVLYNNAGVQAWGLLDEFNTNYRGVAPGTTFGNDDAFLRSDVSWNEVDEQRLVGRITGGRLTGLTVAQIHTLIFGTAIANAVTLGGGQILSVDHIAEATGAHTIVVESSLTMADAKDIILNATTGTKIGTATGQKLAFHNSAPVIQRAGAAQVALAGYVTGAFGLDSDAHMQAMYDLVVEMRAMLVEKGLMKGAA